MSQEFLVKTTKFLIKSGADAKTVGLIVGALSPSFVKENYTIPRKNIEGFIECVASSLALNDLPILDLGCGRRNHRKVFAQKLNLSESDIPYIAIDHYIGDSEIYGKSGPNILGYTNSIPLPSSSVGTVICTEVLEHVQNDLAVISEIGRVLRPNGKLILTVPGEFIPKHEKLPFQRDYRRFSSSELYFKLTNNGFTDVTVLEKNLYDMQINIFAVAKKS